MDKLHSCKIHGSSFLLLFLLQFLSPQLQSSAYTPQDKYFINCGSDSNINTTGRTFVGDSNSGSFFFPRQGSSVVSNQSAEESLLYQTARIFRQPSLYQFDISSNGTYLVRLHFFALSASTNLSTPLFNVSASGFLLLHNFNVQNSSRTPQVIEFLLSINIDKFDIYFVPKRSSFAFVNAIEVFPVPGSFIPDNTTRINTRGSTSNYKGILSSRVLQTIHRINVGGLTLTPDDDTNLWRTWVPDDSYLINRDNARNGTSYPEKPKYLRADDEFFAPDSVYQTAKEMNINTSSQSNNFNITWSFHVSKNAKHFVRVHFCDFVSRADNVLFFYLYINSNLIQEINPFKLVGRDAAPFHIDFVVDSDDTGLMTITIGPNKDSLQKTALLNGLEIMNIKEESAGSVTIAIEGKKKHVSLIVCSAIGGSIVICILAFLLFLGLKRRKPKPVETPVWSPLPAYGGGSSHSRVFVGTMHGSLVPNLNLGLKIPFAEVQFATNNFDFKLLIGKGGFGKVYRGILRNGIKVAVKRSEPGSGQGLPEFQTEIMILSKIRHHHLVSLIGYCDERSEMILVYEFMEKGTLRDHLYSSNLPCLSWKQRLEICIGAARGLHYLHRGSAGGIIHRDVKSTNILLDENHVAKVADFGLSRLGPPDQSHTHVSTGVKGTFGYLDPEYFRSQQLTEKSDVYSFGVVLLEVLCVRPAINPLLPREQVNLAEWGLLCKNKGLLEQIVDPLIRGQINPNSLRKFADIVEKCLNDDGADRPTMSDVLWDLEYALQLQQTAVQREPHEDSTTDASSVLPLPNVQRFPSLSSKLERDYEWVLREDSSTSSVSEVFTQLRINDAR